MRQHWLVIVIAVIAVVLMGGTAVESSVSAQSSRGRSLTAVPGAVGALDPTGPLRGRAGLAQGPQHVAR